MPQTGVAASRAARDRRQAERERDPELEFELFREPAYDRYRVGQPDRPPRAQRNRPRDDAAPDARSPRVERDRPRPTRVERDRPRPSTERDRPRPTRVERDRPRRRTERDRPAAAIDERPRRPTPEPTVDSELARLATAGPGAGVPGRRTVTIRGQGAERYHPESPRRRTEHRHEREGFRPDRAALWAVLLGLTLILVAVTSAHAATF
jgi:hypothetical protein